MREKKIKPLETFYKGYRFRSRLEARWAVFFDAIGADWEYEPQGFELPSGKCYLPDFRLRNVKGRHKGDLWVEVKGKLTKDDVERIWEFVCDGNMAQDAPIVNPLVIVDELMLKPVNDYWDYQRYSYEGAQDKRHYCHYMVNHLNTVDGDAFGAVLAKDENGGCRLDDENGNYEGGVDQQGTIDAYTKARQARFEHGEKG